MTARGAPFERAPLSDEEMRRFLVREAKRARAARAPASKWRQECAPFAALLAPREVDAIEAMVWSGWL